MQQGDVCCTWSCTWDGAGCGQSGLTDSVGRSSAVLQPHLILFTSEINWGFQQSIILKATLKPV
jgi:hypothetical protein